MRKFNLVIFILLVLVTAVIINGLIKRKEHVLYSSFTKQNLEIEYKSPKQVSINQIKNSDLCLVVFQERIYSIPTSFFNIHPVGSLEEWCGQDITYSFNTSMHSIAARIILDAFYYAEINK